MLGADPLVKGGIGEEDYLTIVLPYIHSAREGVIRLGKLHEQFGTYEMNGIGFQDKDEIWWFESIGGHHWMAKKVPDNSYVVVPNQLGIDSFDFTDAQGEQNEHMCSADLVEFITENHLNLTPHEEGYSLADEQHFDTRAAFGSHDDSDHTYNTCRAWFMLRTLNPQLCRKETGFAPESDTLPWSMVPEKLITVEDVKYVLSAHYQGTSYDPYGKHGENSERNKYRAIGINRTNFVALTQLRPYMPEEIMAVEWIAEGSNVFNAFVPFYANVTRTPDYLANTTEKVTTDNFYWANRLIGALADAHFNTSAIHIERYQNTMHSKGHEFIIRTDRKFAAEHPTDVHAFLEAANEEMASIAREETTRTLGNVLYTASNGMKNSFARSDA